MVYLICLILLLASGLFIRLIDLTDPPLDIHPTRQLHSALLARGMYYQSVSDAPEWMIKTAIQQGKREPIIEPPILETLTAAMYRLAEGEFVWVARIFSSIFWVLGGLAFFFLARRLTNSAGAFFSLALYLFIPYGVQASRTFQPDPLMVSLIVTGWWGLYRWHDDKTWGNTLLAGLACGAAILVKNVAIFFLAIPVILILFRTGFVRLLKDKRAWLVAGLAIVPTIVYTWYGTYAAGFLTQQFNFRIFPNLWVDLSNYSRWFLQVKETAGIGLLVLGFAGLFLFRRGNPARFIFGIWLGYILYGFIFAYHIGTHDYYQLPLIPILAVTSAPVGALIYKSWQEQNQWRGAKLVAGILLFLILGAGFWMNRLILTSNDYRPEVTFWRTLGDRLREESVIGLTQDYGYRIAFYGWDSIENWSGSGDLALRDMAGRSKGDVVALLEKRIEGKKYFLVTWFDDFTRQKDVRDYLYAHFPVETGDGYLLFDLQSSLKKD